MRITGYRSVRTRHRWGRPVGDVNGVVEAGVTEVPLLLLETDEGLTGIGLGAHDAIDRVFPAVEGEDPRAVTALYDRMLSWVFKAGHAGATFGTIGALDMALWDLKAKVAGEPLWRMLGARDRFVPGYASCLEYGVDDDGIVALYSDFADRGYASAKLKGGRDARRDIARLRAVREVMRRNSNRPAMLFDVNESWGRHDARARLTNIVESVELTWIEEPVRRWDVDGNRALVGATTAAVATGENLTGLDQYLPLIRAGAVDVVQSGSVWGVTHFLRVAALAHGHDLPVSPVAYNANPLLHAAAAVPNHLTAEVQDLSFPDGLTVDQEFADGGIVLGDALGLGIEVDEARIAALRVESSWSTPSGPHVRPVDAGLRIG